MYDKEFILTCYAVHLSMGNTLKAATIHTITLKKYLKGLGDLVRVNTKFDHMASEEEFKKEKINDKCITAYKGSDTRTS